MTTHELTRRILPERTLRFCAPGDSPSAKDRAAYDNKLLNSDPKLRAWDPKFYLLNHLALRSLESESLKR